MNIAPIRIVLVRAAAVIGGAALITGCGGDPAGPTASGADADVQVRFVVSYDPVAYDPAAARAAVEECLALPGAERGPDDLSDPPQTNVGFVGSDENRQRLRECLDAVPAGTVQESAG